MDTEARDVNLRVLPSNPCQFDFRWYGEIRTELLRKTVGSPRRVLDVGCGRGGTLLTLASQIAGGVGVDISDEEIRAAEEARRRRKTGNVSFRSAPATELPFAARSFDVVLCLGDVLCYSNLYERQERVLSEIRRVLKRGGLVVHDCMNWDWEYRLASQWVFFTKGENGRFLFHRAKRTPSGREICRNYELLPGTPLHRWVVGQDWPVSRQGDRTSLDVSEERRVPQQWLIDRGISRHQHYTPRTLRRQFRNAGFHSISVFAYGQTYDIAGKAGLVEKMTPLRRRLANAEAQVILEQKTGAGPWIFLTARK